jgi:hypothetical protein
MIQYSFPVQSQPIVAIFDANSKGEICGHLETLETYSDSVHFSDTNDSGLVLAQVFCS